VALPVTDVEQDYLGGKLWYISGITSRQIVLFAGTQKVWIIRPTLPPGLVTADDVLVQQ